VSVIEIYRFLFECVSVLETLLRVRQRRRRNAAPQKPNISQASQASSEYHIQLTPQLLQQILVEFTDPTNRMPDDAEFAKAFEQEILSDQNAREILFLIALFDVSTGRADVNSLSVGNYSVEHMMPVKWELNWTDHEMARNEKAERNNKLRTLGNLTLVTGRLNSAMRNAGWHDKNNS
jgi:hypothetical protein